MTAGSTLRDWWALIGRAGGGLLFPTACQVCDAETHGSPFCDACGDELRDAAGSPCHRCAMPMGPFADRTRGCSECRGKALGFDAAVALGPYTGPIRQFCLALKREHNAWMARWVAELVVESRAGAIRRALGPDVGPEPWVVPIPLHWRKRFRRGYNQAEALARGVASGMKLPLRQPLRRVVDTPALALAGRPERARRMKEAFRVARGARLEGRPVLLVDDILTTGATTGAAARALKKAGAERVIVVVVGRAEGRP
ncbi:ComF family protein [Tundrisphaera sp. TA3]|uniref:ComF family protein n=1 Tax=Tundrisphaera sp. TA3 TaxID=3435775 RepID=UPI003EB8648B